MPKDKTPPAPPTGTPPTPDSADQPGQDTPPEAGTTPRRTLTYSTPEEMGDGTIRLRAHDGEGNSLAVTAPDREKAQVALRAGFRALHGETE